MLLRRGGTSNCKSRTVTPGSPFYLVDSGLTLLTGPRTPVPRVLVSSFGFGGSNAHVVVEEFEETRSITPTSAAATSWRLGHPRANRYARRALHAFLERRPRESSEPGFLARMAYTLQVGREPMAERFAAVVASSRRAACSRYVPTGKLVHRPGYRRWRETPDALITGAEGEAFVESLMRAGQIEKLAQLWVSGMVVNWRNLYGAEPPLRLSLPSYPFARTRHPLPKAHPVNLQIPSRVPVVQYLRSASFRAADLDG